MFFFEWIAAASNQFAQADRFVARSCNAQFRMSSDRVATLSAASMIVEDEGHYSCRSHTNAEARNLVVVDYAISGLRNRQRLDDSFGDSLSHRAILCPCCVRMRTDLDVFEDDSESSGRQWIALFDRLFCQQPKALCPFVSVFLENFIDS
jgi:hypothetical protein